VQQVEAFFAEHGLSWAPVLEGGSTFIGVISTSDTLQFHARHGDPSAVRAWQLCSFKPICVDAGTSVADVARAMLAQGVHHVVVTEGGNPVGVVSSMDFVRTFVASS
jgi:signal-transduction protein with cAMP-binding, CBS, and nucleotidyltransferase domain